MKTREEVQDLKQNWLSDPCWDIEDTEGFEDYVDELKNFRVLREAEWTAQRKAKELDRLSEIRTLSFAQGYQAGRRDMARTLGHTGHYLPCGMEIAPDNPMISSCKCGCQGMKP